MTAPNLFTKRHLVVFAVLTAIIGLMFFSAATMRGQQLNPANPSPAASHPEMVLQQGHRRPVSRIMFLPNQKLVASVGEDDRLILWEVASGEAIREIQLPESAYLNDIRLSSDGLRIEFVDVGGERIAYDVKSGKPIENLPALCPEGAESKKSSPNGKFAVCAKAINPGIEPQDDFGHFLWDIQNQRQVSLIKEKPSNWPSLRFSPDSRFLAIEQGDVLRILDVSSGATIRTFQSLELAWFSADGRNLYLSTPPDRRCDCDGTPPEKLTDLAVGGAIEIRDTQSGKLKRRLTGRQLLGFSPDGKTAVLRRKIANPRSVTLEFWDAELATLKQTIPGSFHRFRFSPDGRMVILETWPGAIDQEPAFTEFAEFPRDIALYDWQSGEKKAQLWEDKPDVGEYAFSQDGSTITTVGMNGVVKLRDGKSGATLKTLHLAPPQQREAKKSEDDKPVFSVGLRGMNLNIVISPDGQIVCGAQEKQVLIADLKTSRVIRTTEGIYRSMRDVFLFLQAGAEKVLVQSVGDLPVVIWDLNTLQARLAPRPAPDPAKAESDDVARYVELSPDGRLRAELSKDRKSVTIIEAATNKQLSLLKNGELIAEARFSPDGKTLMTRKGLVVRGNEIDAVSSLLARKVTEIAGGIAGQKEIEDVVREMLSVQAGRTFSLWDAQSGSLKQTFQFNGDLDEVIFLDAGKQIATLHTEADTGEMIVTVWDSLTGKAISSIKAEDKATTLALSPDGSMTISYKDKKTSAFETRTGKLKWEVAGFTKSSLDELFYANGKLVVLGALRSAGGSLIYELRLMETQTGRERLRLPLVDYFTELVGDVSADGRMLMLLLDGGASASASFWDLNADNRHWTARVMFGRLSAAFSPDGKIAALHVDPETVELRDAMDGRLLLSLSIFPGEQPDKAEWIARTPEGYYSASPGAARYIRWRVGDKLLPAEAYAKEFNRPDIALKALQAH